jgi:hypothetical protein
MAKWEAVCSSEEEGDVVIDGYHLLQDGDYVGFIPGHIAIEITCKLNAFDEMLAALKEIQMLDDSGPAGLTWVELGKARNIASEAIAKAEAANV